MTARGVKDDAAIRQIAPPAQAPQQHQEEVDGPHGNRYHRVLASQHERPQGHANEKQQMEECIGKPSERADDGDCAKHAAHLAGLFLATVRADPHGARINRVEAQDQCGRHPTAGGASYSATPRKRLFAEADRAGTQAHQQSLEIHSRPAVGTSPQIASSEAMQQVD